MIFSEDEKRVMAERLDELLWGERRPINDAGRVVLHYETIHALESFWGERWRPHRPVGPLRHEDFRGMLRGPRADDREWRIYRGVYAEPTAVYFRMPLRERSEGLV